LSEGIVADVSILFAVAREKKSRVGQIIIACGLFEAAFLAVTGFNLDAFQGERLLMSNVLFTLWLAMEAARVRLGHKGVEVEARLFGMRPATR